VLGLVLILPVDWFVGIARALTNLIGNCVATVVVAVWENDIDRARAKRVLNRELRYVPADETGNAAPVAGDQAHAL
ncbi:C4-dicarboxylate transporter DctA, partial [Bacteroides thetaiotaomicron]|nr:C4-dicarboxylate transporter DctA [Bacteroides thetaiotaomicron]